MLKKVLKKYQFLKMSSHNTKQLDKNQMKKLLMKIV